MVEDSIAKVALTDSDHLRARQKRTRRRGYGISLLLLLGVAVFVYMNFFTIQVKGRSMLETFREGERLLATRAYWLVGPIKRNDVIVIKGTEPGEFLIKRVNRLGGETVDMLNVPNNWDFENGAFTVPEGYLWVLGDNFAESEDSRAFGPIPLERVVGKVVTQ